MNYLKPIELTHLTINPQLFPSETIIQSQAGIGIYDGKNKDQRYQDGTLYLTSHRLIYVDRMDPHHHSCFMDINLIRQTEYWIGFLTSSPKITLLLGPPPNLNSQSSASFDHQLHSTIDQDHILNHPATSHWTCHVCGFSNPPESKCALCGIPRDLSSTTLPNSSLNLRTQSSFRDHSSSAGLKSSPFQTRSLSNLRPSKSNTPTEPFISPLKDHEGIVDPSTIATTTIKEISCPSCTFFNHPSMSRCEICDSILGTVQLQNLSLNDSPGDSNLNFNDDPSVLQHSRATTPAPPPSFPSGSYIRLSFRKGGDKSFYSNLKKSLQNKTWKTGEFTNQLNEFSRQPSIKNSSLLDDSSVNNPRRDNDTSDCHLNLTKPIGIDRILKNVDSQHQAHQAELTEGLQDLRALMTKAKEMVQMAQSINGRMSNLESSTINSNRSRNDDSTEFSDERKKAGMIRSSLVKLGLPAPAVTIDMVDSDEDFHKELAKELGGLLNRKMNYQQELISSSHVLDHYSSTAGIWPLDEIWCIWNRARGISLISPGEMILACHHLGEYTTPKIQLRTFKSGLRVLHTPYFSLEEFEARLIKRLTNEVIESESDKNQDSRLGSLMTLSTLEIAHFERLSVYLTNELLQSIELGPIIPTPHQNFLPPSNSIIHPSKSSPSIVRDFNPSTGDTSWFLNLISDFVWFDPNFEASC